MTQFKIPTFTRRSAFLAASALAMMAAGLAAAPALLFAQDEEAAAPSVPVEELMNPGALPEVAIGSSDAKVTIVEFFSMTCPHCAEFANKVLPELKKKYVDTGKVRILLREFPHNNRAYAASMLARCVGEDKTPAMIEGLFATQETWAFTRDNPAFKAALLDIAKQSGFTQESFDKCLTDQTLLDNLSSNQKRAREVFGISRIPTIFVGGKKLVGDPSLEAVEKLLEPLLAKS